MRIQIARQARPDTDGLATAYQITNTTAAAASAVMGTGGYMLIGVAPTPWRAPLSVRDLPHVEPQPCVPHQEKDDLVKAYKAMGAENSRLAEEFFPIASEEWPAWGEN